MVKTQVLDNLSQQAPTVKPLSSMSEQHYCRSRDDISSLVKSLRHRKIQITESQRQLLSKYALMTIQFLSEKSAVQSTLFLQALITLDNCLNIYGDILKEVTFTRAFFSNINAFFLQVCGNADSQCLESDEEGGILTSFEKIIDRQAMSEKNKNEDKQKKSQKNFELYSVFYLVVMIIYETNRRRQHSLFIKHLLNGKFLCRFFSLELSKTNKMAKLIGIIITYLVKTINLTSEGQNMKRFILNNLHLANMDERIEFYFFYSLRAVKNHVLLNEVKRFNILEFLITCLEKQRGGNQAYYIYDTIQFLLKKYPVLGYSLLNHSFFNLMEKDLQRYDNQVLKIFELVSPCIPVHSLSKCIKLHVDRLQGSNIDSNHLSIRILSILFNENVDQNTFIYLLKSKVFDIFVEKLGATLDKAEQNSIHSFLHRFLQTAAKMNQQVGVVLYHRLVNQKQNIIRDDQKSKSFIKRVQSLFDSARGEEAGSGKSFSIV